MRQFFCTLWVEYQWYSKVGSRALNALIAALILVLAYALYAPIP